MKDDFNEKSDWEIDQIPRRNRNYLIATVIVILLGMVMVWQVFINQTVGIDSTGNEFTYAQINNSNSGTSQAGGCSMGGSVVGSDCGSCATLGTANEAELTPILQAALVNHVQKTGDQNVTVELIDYGCHYQVVIFKDGVAIQNYHYQNGQFSEM